MLKKFVLIVAISGLMSSLSFARDDALFLDFQNDVRAAINDGSIDNSVKFYLKGTGSDSGKVLARDVVTNKKSSARTLGSDKARCAYVLKSALIQLQNRAKELGATKVVNIVSYYRKNTYSNPKNYECHVGTWVVGVTLKGDLVK